MSSLFCARIPKSLWISIFYGLLLSCTDGLFILKEPCIFGRLGGNNAHSLHFSHWLEMLTLFPSQSCLTCWVLPPFSGIFCLSHLNIFRLCKKKKYWKWTGWTASVEREMVQGGNNLLEFLPYYCLIIIKSLLFVTVNRENSSDFSIHPPFHSQKGKSRL